MSKEKVTGTFVSLKERQLLRKKKPWKKCIILESSLKLTNRLFSIICNTHICIRLIDWFLVFNATFSNISAIWLATSFSDGRSRSTRREPPTMGKQLVNFITCGCESSAPFL